VLLLLVQEFSSQLSPSWIVHAIEWNSFVQLSFLLVIIFQSQEQFIYPGRIAICIQVEMEWN
jgi:hypothetical protein